MVRNTIPEPLMTTNADISSHNKRGFTGELCSGEDLLPTSPPPHHVTHYQGEELLKNVLSYSKKYVDFSQMLINQIVISQLTLIN